MTAQAGRLDPPPRLTGRDLAQRTVVALALCIFVWRAYQSYLASPRLSPAVAPLRDVDGGPGGHGALLYALLYTVQTGRILEEERLLRRDVQYQAYTARVRYRLIPFLF